MYGAMIERNRAQGELVWVSERPVSLDFGGPATVPYIPLPDNPGEVLGIDMIERVTKLHADARRNL